MPVAGPLKVAAHVQPEHERRVDKRTRVAGVCPRLGCCAGGVDQVSRAIAGRVHEAVEAMPRRGHPTQRQRVLQLYVGHEVLVFVEDRVAQSLALELVSGGVGLAAPVLLHVIDENRLVEPPPHRAVVQG